MGWLNFPKRHIRTTLKLSILLWPLTAFAQSSQTQSPDTSDRSSNSSPQVVVPQVDSDPMDACVVVGAPGEPQFGKMFSQWANLWVDGLSSRRTELIGNSTEQTSVISDRESLKRWIDQTKVLDPKRTRWLILLGHGTFDGKTTKFNLRGEDISSSELHLREETCDLDHDGAVSILEAFICGSQKTKQYYADNRLLATEHPLLDDNADSLGTSGESYRGVRPVAMNAPSNTPPEKIDGRLAKRIALKVRPSDQGLSEESLAAIEKLEIQLESLRSSKELLQPDDYYSKLEKIFLEIAKIRFSARP